MSIMLYSCSLHVLIPMTLGYEDTVRTVMVAHLVNHHPWFSILPGLPFNVSCEAMLSRVVANMAHYPHMDSLEQVHDPFVLVTPPLDAKKNNLTNGNIPKVWPRLINNLLRRMCECWEPGMLPTVQWSSNNNLWFPLSNLVPYSSQFLFKL